MYMLQVNGTRFTELYKNVKYKKRLCPPQNALLVIFFQSSAETEA